MISPRSYEPNPDSGLNTPEPLSPIDTFAEARKHFEDLDYDVEVFDWECFEQDMDTIEKMDFDC
jgi:hypothetical protein